MKDILAFHLPRALLLLAAACLSTPALAQTWPTKPVKLLVGSPPGGPSDITARLFAEQLGRRGQPVVVENRPGAGNSLAASAAAKAEPDGHTLVLSPDTVLTVSPLVYRNQNFDPRQDLANVAVLTSFSQMLVCHPSVGVRTANELVAKARTASLNYASGGPGVPGHLAAEMFLQTTGVRMEHVPYRGPAPATTAVLAGEVACGFLATPTVIPHVKAGKLVPLAVSSATPSPLAPEVPTLARALNQPGLDVSFRLVLQVARATPPAVQAQIERAALEIMRTPELRSRLLNSDLVAQEIGRAQAQQLLDAEMARWEPLVRRLELKSD